MTLMPPNSAYRRFDVYEIFFARTDARGIIQRENHVFQRVSGYDCGMLIKAPHKVFRHPDMPKGVFHLVWERIQGGTLNLQSDPDGRAVLGCCDDIPIGG